MKIPFVDYKLYILAKNKNNFPDNALVSNQKTKHIIQTTSRASMIIKDFIGTIINVYDGKNFRGLHINKVMLGHRLGEFILTKKLGSSIHNSERNRKKKEKIRRKITQKKVRKTTTVKTSSVKAKKKNEFRRTSY